MLVRLADDLRWRCPIGWNVLPDAPGDMPVPAPGRRFRPFSGLLAYMGATGVEMAWLGHLERFNPAGGFRGVSFCGRPVWIEWAWPCAGPGVDWVVGLCSFWSFIPAAPCRRGLGGMLRRFGLRGFRSRVSGDRGECLPPVSEGWFRNRTAGHWGIRPGLPQLGSEVGLRGIRPGLPQAGCGGWSSGRRARSSTGWVGAGGWASGQPAWFSGHTAGFSTVWGCGQTNPLDSGAPADSAAIPAVPDGMGPSSWGKSFFPYIYRKLNVCIPPN